MLAATGGSPDSDQGPGGITLKSADGRTARYILAEKGEETQTVPRLVSRVQTVLTMHESRTDWNCINRRLE